MFLLIPQFSLQSSEVFQNNYFEFNEQYLKQIRGTAIGTKFAPPCATIYMAALEEDFLEALIKKPWLCWRYIDDIFMIWQHGEDEMKICVEKLNNFHPSIKFTCEYSLEKVNYLDVQVIVREGKLIIDLHVESKLTVINTSTLHHAIHTTVLNRYLIVKH